jgi:NADH dehydrogenase, FAD-containing subunit
VRTMSTPKILILGAGYGGLMTALKLQKALSYGEADVTLINKHEYHYLTTQLHEPAAGTGDPDNARVYLDELLDERKIRFVKAVVTEIKPQERKVETTGGTFDYDYLVIGLGSEPETFGIQGLKEYAFSIRSLNAVRLIREHIEYNFARYKNEPEREELLTIVVGGAGFTGIEFVGELADRVPELCKEFDVDPAKVKIINIEAAPTALPGFDPELVEYAMNVLQKKGVTFRINTPIKECTPEGVVLGTGEEIKAGTVVWTGGVRGNSLVEKAGFETMRGRVKVDEYLRAPGHENVFVVGDCSLIFNEQGRPYPPTAQIAIQEGENCARNLVALIRGGSLEPFKPNIRGTVASLGRGEAIGIVGGRKLTGTAAAWMKKLIDLRYLYLIGGLSLVLRKGRHKLLHV